MKCPECNGAPELLLVTPVKMRKRCTECGHKWSEPRDKPFDLVVTGTGLYRIRPATQAARVWIRQNLGRDRVVLDGDTICDGGDYCRAIVAAAVAEGIRVSVNGEDMEGFGA